MEYPRHYGVIVVGGGHAGTEAALASARMGVATLLLTQSIEQLGQMSCNPAIGGIGKSHLVKEIDALGGAMARATDRAGIQFRVLNSRKGPAVRAPRAQADRVLYRHAIRCLIETQPHLEVFQQPVVDLIVEGEQVRGVRTQMGLSFRSETVVLATGTFLGGKIHIGLENYGDGRAGGPPANESAAGQPVAWLISPVFRWRRPPRSLRVQDIFQCAKPEFCCPDMPIRSAGTPRRSASGSI